MIHKADFMCTCNPDGKKRCNQTLRQVCQKLSNKHHKVTRSNLLTTVVYALEWGLPEGYNGRITELACDQWCGVSAKVFWLPEDGGQYQDYASIFVQCDEVEHGVARAYELAMEVTTEKDKDGT